MDDRLLREVVTVGSKDNRQKLRCVGELRGWTGVVCGTPERVGRVSRNRLGCSDGSPRRHGLARSACRSSGKGLLDGGRSGGVRCRSGESLGHLPGMKNGTHKRTICLWEFPDKREPVTGGSGRCRPKFPRLCLGALRRPRRTHRTLHPRRRFLQGSGRDRVDHWVDRVFRSFLTTDLLVFDDLGLYRLSAHQPLDLFGGSAVGHVHAGRIHRGEFDQQGRGRQRLAQSDRVTRV